MTSPHEYLHPHLLNKGARGELFLKLHPVEGNGGRSRGRCESQFRSCTVETTSFSNQAVLNQSS